MQRHVLREVGAVDVRAPIGGTFSGDYTVIVTSNATTAVTITGGTFTGPLCLEEGSAPCSRADSCRTLPLWKGLEKVVSEYLGGFTVRDLMKE